MSRHTQAEVPGTAHPPTPTSSNPSLHSSYTTIYHNLGLLADQTRREREASGDEEPEAEQRRQRGGGGCWGGDCAQQRRRRRRVQAGEEGRGEEPAAAHEGALPQALLPHPALRRQARVAPLGRRGGGVRFTSQQGHGDAAGPPGKRSGVHQAAQGSDRRAEAAQGRRLLPRAAGLGGGRRAHAGDRGAVPGRDAGGGAGERGRAAVQAARDYHGAGAGGRGGRQCQLLRRRRQDLLHHPFAGAQLPDRARGVQGLREAARSAPRLIAHDHCSKVANQEESIVATVRFRKACTNHYSSNRMDTGIIKPLLLRVMGDLIMAVGYSIE